MSTSDKSDSTDIDSLHTDKLAQLLAKAEPRKVPPARMEVEVRAAVHAEWQHLLQARKGKQQRRWLAAAAVLVCAVSAGWLTLNLGGSTNITTNNSAPVVATITQLQGAVALNEVTVDRQASGIAAQIHTKDVLRSRDDGGLRIQLHNGISLRVAANTELRWLAADSLQLVQGAIYVDSHANVAPLTVHTVRGEITHLGTRYLVNVNQQSLHVAVREGQVSVHAGNDQITVGALQQVHMNVDGYIARSDVQLSDATWQWADTLAESFALDNHSVAEFLQWVANETGSEVNYANPAVKAAASTTVLHGQPIAQAPLQALKPVLVTTDFHVAIEGRQLVVTQQR